MPAAPPAPASCPLAGRLAAVHERIAAATRQAGRAPGSVRLLAVSKTFDADQVRAAHACGQVAFGENYAQEALAKVNALADLRERLEWHFIGPLQSNKTRGVAERFDWVQSVERLSIAQRLDRQRSPTLPRLNVCIQVNIDAEASKSGVAPEQVPELAEQITRLPRLALRGLMALPSPHAVDARDAPRRLRALFDALNASGFALDTLSCGMSGDLEAAILEGATMVRIGTAIFGARETSQ